MFSYIKKHLKFKYINFLYFSHGYAFQAASLLSGDLTQIHDLIEDIVAQADEVDEKYLQVIQFMMLHA